MGDVIHLHRFRKAKQRQEARRRADENARRHGRTAAERAREKAEREQLETTVDGARRSPVDEDPR